MISDHRPTYLNDHENWERGEEEPAACLSKDAPRSIPSPGRCTGHHPTVPNLPYSAVSRLSHDTIYRQHDSTRHQVEAFFYWEELGSGSREDRTEAAAGCYKFIQIYKFELQTQMSSNEELTRPENNISNIFITLRSSKSKNSAL
jgi:hypothetical protein